MGLIPSTLKLLIHLHTRLGFNGPVVTLGNQEIWATYDDLTAFFKELACPVHIPSAVVPHTSRVFTQDPALAQLSQKFVHARVFFEMMGISEYCDIDKYDRDKPVYLHDMNLPIPTRLLNKFSLLIDGGTAEHIFDIKQTMTNIVGMLKVGGYVVHIGSFSIDHGFFAFSPCFFFDFYKANGFDDFLCYIMQVDYRDFIKNYAEPCPYFEYRYGISFETMIDPSRQMLVFFLAKKVMTCPELRIPTQGIFQENTVSPAAGQPSLYESFVPDVLQPLLQPFRPAFGRLYNVMRRPLQRRKFIKRMKKI